MRKTEQILERKIGSAPQVHRTVERVTAILDLAADRNGVRMSEIAVELRAPKSSVHSLLRGLVAVGYLEERSGRYTVGTGLVVVVRRAGLDLPDQAVRDELSRLSSVTGETAIYGVRSGRSVLYTDAVESSQPVRYAVELLERRPLAATSIGKAILANLPLAQHAAIGIRADTHQTLFTELDDVHVDGVAYNRQETVPGVCGVAAAVRAAGSVVGGVAVAGPAERLEPEFASAAEAVITSALRIGNAIEAYRERTVGHKSDRRFTSRSRPHH